MVRDYGEDEYGSEIYGGDRGTIIDEDLIDYFPEILPREPNSVLARYLNTFDISFEGHDEGTVYVKFSRYLTEAEGDDLDRIGALFGELGRRGTRNDDEYRSYLGSLVRSFTGRGSVSGLKFAIAAAVNTDPESIEITEDFVNNEYSIQINDADAEFISGAINTLAQLADPSGVELSEAPVITTEGDEVYVSRQESAVIDTVSGLGSGTLSLDGTSDIG